MTVQTELPISLEDKLHRLSHHNHNHSSVHNTNHIQRYHFVHHLLHHHHHHLHATAQQRQQNTTASNEQQYHSNLHDRGQTRALTLSESTNRDARLQNDSANTNIKDISSNILVSKSSRHSIATSKSYSSKRTSHNGGRNSLDSAPKVVYRKSTIEQIPPSQPTYSATQRSQIQFILIAAAAYVLSPIDLVPEVIFGVFGIIDDIIFLIMCLMCIGIVLLYPIFRKIHQSILQKFGLTSQQGAPPVDANTNIDLEKIRQSYTLGKKFLSYISGGGGCDEQNNKSLAG